VLELEHVTKRFGDFTAVDDVSLAIPRGCVYGFLGPNGAGKTTTIRMIVDILRPTKGRISILGAASALDVRTRIGYLPEEKGLYKKMTATATIAYFGTLKGMRRAAAKRRARELLERHGLTEFADSKIEDLSKGMGQKVQVLSAIAHSPEFVILDEPFSGLDPVAQQVLEELILDMARSGVSIVFSTHVMQHAERLCERLLLIAKGRKIFDGTVADAKRTIPRRVLVRTAAGAEALGALDGVVGVMPVLALDAGEDAHAEAGVDDAANTAKTGSTGSTGSTARTGNAGSATNGANAFEAGDARRSTHRRGASPACSDWEIRIEDRTSAQQILEQCFARGIVLQRFDHSEPSLHDAFVALVGGQASQEQRP
jgi:ABC-2 type transport system ATP-binding protein